MIGLIILALFLSGHSFSLPVKVPNAENVPSTRWLPSDEPFISYPTFRTLCDHIIDQSCEWFDPDTVKKGDIIFLSAFFLEWFTKEIHDPIRSPYILYCGDVGGGASSATSS